MSKTKDFKKISVLIISKNRYKTLSRCLKSLSMQTANFFELIIINDISGIPGAGQQNELKIRNLVKNFPASVVYKQVKFNSYAKSRNLALKLSTGSVIMFLDDDCYIPKNTIEFINKSLQTNSKISGFVPKVIPYKQNLYSNYYSDFINSAQIKNQKNELYWFTFTCVILTRKCIGENLFNTKTNTGEDVLMSTKICKQCKIVYNPNLTVNHEFVTHPISFINKQFNYAKDFALQNATLKNNVDSKYYPRRKVQLLFLPVFIFFNSKLVSNNEIRQFDFPNKYFLPSLIRHISIHLGIYSSKLGRQNLFRLLH